MEFPVDVLGSVRTEEEEEQAAYHYMTQLRYISLADADTFTLSSHRMVRISLSNVGFMPIYGGDLKHKVLALFAPDDQLTAVALFLAGRWWSVEDILKTSDRSRTGLIKVQSFVERIVLYVLNRVVYRVGEMDQPEVPFLCHGQHDFAKLLWKGGQAIGFYSVKPKDSLCSNFVTQRYQLPVMDSIFVRKRERGSGHGLEMLENFVDSFTDDQLGLKYPLSLTMYKVCRKYLGRYPADQDLLWVVEGVGGAYQRESVFSKIKALALNGVIRIGKVNGDHSSDVNMEDDCPHVTGDSMVVNKLLDFTEVMDETPLSTNRSGRQNKRGREETEEFTDESQPLKMNRLEVEEAGVTTCTTTERGEEEEEEVEEEEEDDSREEQTAVASELEKDITTQEVEEVNGELTDDQEVEEGNGELTDDQEEEEKLEEIAEKQMEGEVALKLPEAPPDIELTEEDWEMKKEEEVETKKSKDTVKEDFVESTEPVVEKGDLFHLVKQPAYAPEEDHSPVEADPGDSSISGEHAVEDTHVVLEEWGVLEEAGATLMEGEEEEAGEEAEGPRPPEKSTSAQTVDLDSSSQETVLQVGLVGLSFQPLEEAENKPPYGEVEKVGMNQEDEAIMVEGEKEEEESESSDDGEKVPSSRRSGSDSLTPPKRKSKRLSRGVTELQEPDTEQSEVEEEKAKATKEEEGAVEQRLVEKAEDDDDEEEQPPVVDQRALRRKSKTGQTPKKARGKRRS
ncbi:hypothetical protein DPEC_G00334220 [Dallia pectoralis]|uniref:Uncharacterized protein n=1 Tax=Dallia pectoralis TaxID=75939 RepID=A0ACC2F6Z0_DALPE|nr:hypothetical protein DPEC_G00334220 [Dallia pectoralis]